MKNLNYLNYFLVGFPLTLFLLGIIESGFMYFGLIFIIFTGIFQVLIGVKMLFDEPKNGYIRAYLVSVFFIFCITINRL